MRDTQLDIYRGLTIAYIVCVIHMVYWLGMAGEPLRSLILFEMPIIFFISGAAMKVSHSRKTFSQRLINRFKRIVVPYLLYCLVCLLVMLASVSFRNSLSPRSIISIPAHILLGDGITQCPYCSHLWFIWPYLLISCSFDFQCILLRKVGCGWYLTACLGLFLLSQCFDLAMFKTLTAYNLFFMAGYCLYKSLSVKQIASISAVSLCILVCYSQIGGGNFTPMQGHKFPPDSLFVVFGTFALSILSIMFTYIKIPMCRMFTPWIRRGYEIYLYQNFFFIAAAMMLRLPMFENRGSRLLLPLLMFAVVTVAVHITFSLIEKVKAVFVKLKK